jgi:hypothetical protein
MSTQPDCTAAAGGAHGIPKVIGSHLLIASVRSHLTLACLPQQSTVSTQPEYPDVFCWILDQTRCSKQLLTCPAQPHGVPVNVPHCADAAVQLDVCRLLTRATPCTARSSAASQMPRWVLSVCHMCLHVAGDASRALMTCPAVYAGTGQRPWKLNAPSCLYKPDRCLCTCSAYIEERVMA